MEKKAISLDELSQYDIRIKEYISNQKDTWSLNVYPQEFLVSDKIGNVKLFISTNQEWTIETESQGIYFDVNSGTNSAIIHIGYDYNLIGNNNTATINIKSNSEIKSITIERKPNEWYGIEYDTSSSNPVCTRIASDMSLHRTLPIHNLIRGCILDDYGHVIKYLPEDSWGGEQLDGSKGQVMVEIPEHYISFTTNGTKNQIKMSLTNISGYKRVDKYYVSAYQASLDRFDNKLSSVDNGANQYRGGDNTSSWDSTYRSLLRKPATNMSLIESYIAAHNRNPDNFKWNIMTYEIWKAIYWLFVVEYATLNVQEPYNAQLTTEGYHQGGLGEGVTTLTQEEWSNYNNNNPFIKCGITDFLGNNTGVVSINQSGLQDIPPLVTQVPRYRGIEMPFGHIAIWLDGIYLFEKTTNGGYPVTIKIAIHKNPNNTTYSILKEQGIIHDNGEFVYPIPSIDWNTYFSNTTIFRIINSVELTSDQVAETEMSGILKKIIFEDLGDIIAKEFTSEDSDSSLSEYYSDTQTLVPPFYSNFQIFPIALCGGFANSGLEAGLTFLNISNGPAAKATNIGNRLCFIP